MTARIDYPSSSNELPEADKAIAAGLRLQDSFKLRFGYMDQSFVTEYLFRDQQGCFTTVPFYVGKLAFDQYTDE